MKANPPYSQRFTSGNETQLPAINTWKGRQGGVGDRFKVIVDNVCYVGIASSMVETPEGDKLVLWFLDDRCKAFLRKQCKRTRLGRIELTGCLQVRLLGYAEYVLETEEPL
uniref:Protein kinase domain-containing protein n=1 Tax=Ganoderma boninense TaxID=34458 RepID=A0A5K1K2A4_9APHY|nr:Protein kinase domain-containing protein [Ganoderma boninense]